MALDESVAIRGEIERYRSWLRSLAEELRGLFLLIDSSGVLIDAVAHGELQRRLGGRGLLVGATVQHYRLRRYQQINGRRSSCSMS